jgi:Domain of Unknown Function (DUF1080)
VKYFSVLALAAAVGVPAPADEPKETKYAFGKNDEGKVPAGWKAEKTGKGEGSVWKVEPDATAPSKSGFVLVQTAEGPSSLFNLCVVQDANYTDLEMRVAFKALKGKEDQGGGLVWRYQDANNYYLTRYNPLESNFRVYKVIDGVRKQLMDKSDLKLKAGEWHTIAVKHAGKKIECRLDGEKYLEVEDDAITKGGKIGLWTKADAQTAFDQLVVGGGK